MMPENANCPFCASPMATEYLYLRGIGGALHRSDRPDVGLFSRKGLEQINLDKISRTPAGTQVVLDTLHCSACDAICFQASK
jgi:hypothetical protein